MEDVRSLKLSPSPHHKAPQSPDWLIAPVGQTYKNPFLVSPPLQSPAALSHLVNSILSITSPRSTMHFSIKPVLFLLAIFLPLASTSDAAECFPDASSCSVNSDCCGDLCVAGVSFSLTQWTIDTHPCSLSLLLHCLTELVFDCSSVYEWPNIHTALRSVESLSVCMLPRSVPFSPHST